MRIIKTIIVTTALAVLTSCGSDSTNELATSTNTQTPELKAETPSLQKHKVDLGKIKMSQDGTSIGKNTELTKLKELVAIDSIDLIEINWIWDSSPKYDDMGMRITYNKISSELQLVYTKNNVKEEYTNVHTACLLDYLKAGEKALYALEDYCKDTKYDFNNREMINKAVGKKPLQNELTGTVRAVELYVKDNAHNAESIDFIEWTKVNQFGEYWIVRAKYKGTNAFGGIVTENQWFYIQNEKIVKTKTIY